MHKDRTADKASVVVCKGCITFDIDGLISGVIATVEHKDCTAAKMGSVACESCIAANSYCLRR